MGKNEMKPMPLWQLAIGVVLIPVIFAVSLFLYSVPASQLEEEYIEEAEYKVEGVGQTKLPGNGLALVSENTKEDALMQIYAKVPILNRYIFTESYDFNKDSTSNTYAVKVWHGHAKLIWENVKVTPTAWTDDYGWGARGPILIRLLLWELILCSYFFIRNDVIKTRREREANPVKNY